MHWRIIFRSVVSNWTGYAVTVLAGFFLSPMVVRSLGNTGYGIWTLVLSVAGYFGLLDLGIRSSVGRFVARHLSLKDDVATNRTVSTALFILSVGGLITLIGTIGLSFVNVFRIEPQFQMQARIALLITGLNIACALPLGVFSALLSAMERFDIISGITITAELTRAALILLVLRNEYGIVALASVAMLTSVAQYSAMFVVARRLHRPLRISAALVDWATVRELLGFGIYRFVAIVATQLIFFSGSLVVGTMIGVASVTFYAIAGSLVNYARTIVLLVTDSLYPAATRLDAQEDKQGLRDLLVVGTRLAMTVALPLCIGLIFLGRQFITLWMGPEYGQTSGQVLIVLTLAQFTSMPQYVTALVLAAMARHRVLAGLSLAEGVVNVVLSVILAQQFGLTGVAWGTVVPHWIVTGLIVPIYTLRIVGMNGRDYLLRGFLRPIVAALPATAIALTFSLVVTKLSWPIFIGEAAAICLVFGTMSWFVCLDGEQREMIRERIASLLGREPVIHEA